MARQVKVQKGKSSSKILTLKEKCGLWWKKTNFHPFLPSYTASLLSFDGNYTGVIRPKWTSKSLSSRRHIEEKYTKKNFPHIRKRKKIIKLNNKYKENSYVHAHLYKPSDCAAIANIFGAGLALSLVFSSFLLPCCSYWPMRSGTLPYSLVALPLAALLNWKKWLNTEMLANWPKWHTILARQLRTKYSNVTRLVATQMVRNKYSLLK